MSSRRTDAQKAAPTSLARGSIEFENAVKQRLEEYMRTMEAKLKAFVDATNDRFNTLEKKLENERWGRKNEHTFAATGGTLYLPHALNGEEWTTALENAFPGRVCDFKVWADLTNPIDKEPLAKYYRVPVTHLDGVLMN